VEAANRPSRIARAFAARIKNCEARGPAPHDTASRMNAGADGAVGRVERASATAYFTT
jgi:hypothetical protein